MSPPPHPRDLSATSQRKGNVMGWQMCGTLKVCGTTVEVHYMSRKSTAKVWMSPPSNKRKHKDPPELLE